MKNVVLLLVFAAILASFASIHAQEFDSFILTNARCMPGDTATITLLLNNQSFSVGGFRAVIALPDSFQAQFIFAGRGADVIYFDYINFVPFTAGVVGVTGIASLPPRLSSPLPRGSHELASLKIAVSETVPLGAIFPVIFSIAGDYCNAISDSSGNIVIEPSTVNGQIVIGQPISIDDDVSIPATFNLRSNYPNPFNASTTISFTLSTAGYMSLEIYDIQGRKVCCLLDEYVAAGDHNIIWNSLTDDGYAVASGVYLYRLSHDNNAITKKMNLIK